MGYCPKEAVLLPLMYIFRSLSLSSSKLKEMKALRFTAKEKKLELLTVPVPTIKNTKHVLIKVAYAGVCGTDLHIMQGEFPSKQDGSITLGHEFSGTVTEVGSGVTTCKKGDKVAVDPNSGCGCCKFCRTGAPHFCESGGLFTTIGIYRDGGWAEYALVPENQVHVLHPTITLKQGALCEPFSCLAHAWDLINPITVGQDILIVGAGIIGNLCVATLHLQGHRKVTVSEPNPVRLDMVKKLKTGFKLITPDQLKKNQEANPNYLFDTIIECSGHPPAMEHAVTLLKPGGKLCIFGVAPPNGKMSISPFDVFYKELTIVGAKINPFSFPKALGLIAAMGDRYLNYDSLGVKTFKLSQYKEAIEELKKGNIAKAVFRL